MVNLDAPGVAIFRDASRGTLIHRTLGAYGHPWLLEYWFAGTTYDFLNWATVSVLISH